MAIFGDLADMPAPDVMRMLGPRSGKLYIRPNPRKQFELHLRGGDVLCFKEDGLPVHDPAALRRALATFLELRQGDFDFSPLPEAELEHTVNVTRQAVLELAARLKVDTPSPDDQGERTLDGQTRFKLKPDAEDLELSDNLKTFLQRAHRPLSMGCNALELAEVLDLHPGVVRLYLLRLRTLGQIVPVRAYAADYRGYQATPPAAPSANPPEQAVAPAAAVRPPPPPPAAQPFAPVPPQIPPKSLLRRLLSAFSFGGK